MIQGGFGPAPNNETNSNIWNGSGGSSRQVNNKTSGNKSRIKETSTQLVHLHERPHTLTSSAGGGSRKTATARAKEEVLAMDDLRTAAMRGSVDAVKELLQQGGHTH